MGTINRITRRTFLGDTAKLSLVGLSASTAQSLLGAEAGRAARGTTWQIGCYTRVFDQFEFPVAIDAIAEAGFKYVGLMTTKAKNWVLIRTATPAEEVAGMHQEIRNRGLKVASVYGEFAVKDSLEAGVRDLRVLIDHCSTCQCANLMLGGTTDEKVYPLYYKTVAECCDYAAAKGIGLSIKPHGGQNATGPQCRKIIDLVGKKNFGLWYDPGNVFYYSDGKLDPVEDAATVDGLVVGMSVKDYLPPKEVLVNIGAGKVNFPAVFARLKKGGFTQGPLVIECLARGPLETVTAEAKKARLFVEQLVGQTKR